MGMYQFHLGPRTFDGNLFKKFHKKEEEFDLAQAYKFRCSQSIQSQLVVYE
jgi:hypothetical protein